MRLAHLLTALAACVLPLAVPAQPLTISAAASLTDPPNRQRDGTGPQFGHTPTDRSLADPRD